MTYFSYTVNGDNHPPDRGMSDLIDIWNESYASPKFLISTTETLVIEFEVRYGDYIPRYIGDLTTCWEDGSTSTVATLSAMNRTNSDRLNQFELLWKLNNSRSYPFNDLSNAWRNIILFSVYTWGTSASGTGPNSSIWKNSGSKNKILS